MSGTVPPLLRPKPWGFWATAAFGAAVIGFFLFAQALVVVAFVLLHHLPLSQLDWVATDGRLLCWATLASAPLAAALTVLFAWLRKTMTVREYLALRWPTWRQTWPWMLGLAWYCVLCDGVSVLLERPVVPDVMVEIYRSAENRPLVWATFLLAAPLFEEIFFRGFLFTGFRESRIGTVGAILLPSLAWTAMHLQYDWLGLLYLLVAGLLLGAVRWRSGSVWLCVGLHTAMNAVATLQTEWLLRSR